ncbi:hypothetical protein C6Q17_07515 [Burkholderia contaminans]|nr:hypothetical protein C6Q17_07515 [Burkholderia contaminans]
MTTSCEARGELFRQQVGQSACMHFPCTGLIGWKSLKDWKTQDRAGGIRRSGMSRNVFGDGVR